MDRFDLGAHTRRISSTSPAAQKWFNLGLNWSYGFNQEEGVKLSHPLILHRVTKESAAA